MPLHPSFPLATSNIILLEEVGHYMHDCMEFHTEEFRVLSLCEYCVIFMMAKYYYASKDYVLKPHTNI